MDNRKEFEQWLISDYGLRGTWVPERNSYAEYTCQVAWKGWQACAQQTNARVAELTEMFAQGFDADGDPDEWRERAMRSVDGGLPSANAFIKRRQADAIQDWLYGSAEMGELDEYAQRLRQQADEAENE